MAYTKTTWRNGSAPAITAEQLNRMEQGIEDAYNGVGLTDEIIDDKLGYTPANNTDVQQQFENTNARIDNTNEAVEALGNRVTTAEGDIDTIEGNITTINGKFTTMNIKSATLDNNNDVVLVLLS